MYYDDAAEIEAVYGSKRNRSYRDLDKVREAANYAKIQDYMMKGRKLEKNGYVVAVEAEVPSLPSNKGEFKYNVLSGTCQMIESNTIDDEPPIKVKYFAVLCKPDSTIEYYLKSPVRDDFSQLEKGLVVIGDNGAVTPYISGITYLFTPDFPTKYYDAKCGRGEYANKYAEKYCKEVKEWLDEAVKNKEYAK